MRPEDLQAIRERVHKATQGPWMDRRQEVDWSNTPMPLMVVSKGGDIIGQTYVGMTPGCLHNAEFIAHAREDVPKLLDEIERLRGALEHIREYWNRDNNTQAMADACWSVIEIADQALAGETV